ncbi:MAG: type II toxin-antitoxin system HicB family antitoxin [bacterium]
MKFRAVIKKTDDWWIGWLADFPGVNAQERTKEDLLESLKIGAEDMLQIELEVPQGGEVVGVDIPMMVQ